MKSCTTILDERLAAVRRELDEAARRAGRRAGDVTLVVVTKSAPPAILPLLAAAGVRDVGESRVQAGQRRRPGHEAAFRWHLVGHLQSNKARPAVATFDVLHGIDSADLLLRIDRLAGELGRAPELFLQVSLATAPGRHGLPPAQLPAAVLAGRELRHARLVGLMTMAAGDGATSARATFAELRLLRDRVAPGLRQLSMGMSDDFAVAVEEGATCVRVGRRLVADLPLLAQGASP
jgi:pyridoxal phosphate enzyme (YggS family)